MSAVLFDLDGVIYEGESAIAGASEIVAWFQERSIRHLFLTNTTSRPRSVLVEKLARMGIEADVSQILTPPVAVAHWLRENNSGNTALFVPDATRKEFAGLPLLEDNAESGASAVVIGDLGEEWNFAVLNRAFRLLMSDPGTHLLALGMTRYWRAPDGFRLDVAPFVAALEHATGTKALVFGKPAERFFKEALHLLNEDSANTFMIGDDIYSDIEASQKLGLQGILVRTGKFQASDLEQGVEPAAVVDSIADIPRWWQKNVAS